MDDDSKYSYYAILSELSRRDFKRKLELFPDEQRYYVILASGIIGAENAKRIEDLPAAVAHDGEQFVSKLMTMADAGKDEIFKKILEAYLLETIRDELRNCCANCMRFNECIGLDQLSVGSLFRRRAYGDESPTVRKEIAVQVETALRKAPHIESDKADLLCSKFVHHCSVSRLGELFGRYSGIAMDLHQRFGLDYRGIQNQMIALNMEFCKKSGHD